MKGLSMQIDWRTVQLFLETDGVVEVQIDAENNQKIRCTCSSFNNATRCKHAKFVKKQMDANDGFYSIHIPEDVDDDAAFIAMSTPESFRDFIIKYGKVEVID